VFEIFEYKPYKRNAKQIKIKAAKKITVNFKKLLVMIETYNHKININKELSSIRLDKILTKKLVKYSRMQIKMLIKNGNVKLNNQPILNPSYLVRENDNFEISIIQSNEIKYTGEDIKLDILYEDNDLLVIDKKAGIVTHPAPGNETGTLVQALLYHAKNKLSDINGNNRPGIVHRLDKNTSGVMVVAKNNLTHVNLANQFKLHSITRKYQAITWGLPANQNIEGYIERHRVNRKKMSLNNQEKGKFSKTEIKLIKSFQNSSLIECTLHTGRTHQIRLHLTSINAPIVGDGIYGKNKIYKYGLDKKTFNKFLILKNFPRQALHATHLGFFHPTLKKNVEFNSKLPEDMENLLNLLLKY
jgi:23S rRNA pseudouridine1911/1915/1917 synthase